MISTDNLPRPIAFLCSSGSSLRAVQVGMLRALLGAGVVPDLLLGTSAGAINAAYIGRSFDAARIEALAQLWRGLLTSDVFGSFGLGSIVRALRKKPLGSRVGIRDIVEIHIATSYESLAILTTIVTTNALTGASSAFSAGPLQRHIIASASIPGVFPKVDIDGVPHMDGAISAHVPIVAAIERGARTFLVVLDGGYPCRLAYAPQGLLTTLMYAMALMMRHQSSGTLRLVGAEHTLIYMPAPCLLRVSSHDFSLYMPAPCPLRVSSHDFSQAASLIEVGTELLAAFLEHVEIDGPGIYGHPHVH
ncbi:MAG: NTE family protein [Myxococcota bacterium]|jgi:NTE family protein